jgi:hypothetical protein
MDQNQSVIIPNKIPSIQSPLHKLLLHSLDIPADVITYIIFEYAKQYTEPKFYKNIGSCGQDDGQFKNPYGICMDKNEVYVADSDNHRIQVFNKKDLKFLRKFGSYGQDDGQFNYPYGICMDQNEVYVADSGNHRIQVFDKKDLKFLRKFGSYGHNDGQFYCPICICMNQNEVYVVDSNNHRIQVWKREII